MKSYLACIVLGSLITNAAWIWRAKIKAWFVKEEQSLASKVLK